MRKKLLVAAFVLLALSCLGLVACTDHTHRYADEWKMDATNHWYECECGDKKAVGRHDFVDNVCSVCGVATDLSAFVYDTVDGDMTIRGLRAENATAIIIPDGVKIIGYGAFNTCMNLTTVIIPDSVTEIGDSAFYACARVTSFEIPDSVTKIGNRAFDNCASLTSIDIPDSVQEIDYAAFGDCTALTTVTIGSGATHIKEGVFSGSGNLESITVDNANGAYYSENDCLVERSSKMLIAGCQNGNIPQGVETIGTRAFDMHEKLTSVTFSDSVSEISEEAFKDCSNLTSVALGNVVVIGYDAFSGCGKIDTITAGSGNAKYYGEQNCLIEKENKVLVVGCKGSVIPQDVAAIADYAFLDCRGLTSVTIPTTVVRIGNSAFAGCADLKSVTMEGGVMRIGSNAFSSCSALTSVVIPSSVIAISMDAFYNCEKLTSVEFKDPEGWTADSIELSAEDLQNAQTAAQFLTDTYFFRNWTKGLAKQG